MKRASRLNEKVLLKRLVTLAQLFELESDEEDNWSSLSSNYIYGAEPFFATFYDLSCHKSERRERKKFFKLHIKDI